MKYWKNNPWLSKISRKLFSNFRSVACLWSGASLHTSYLLPSSLRLLLFEPPGGQSLLFIYVYHKHTNNNLSKFRKIGRNKILGQRHTHLVRKIQLIYLPTYLPTWFVQSLDQNIVLIFHLSLHLVWRSLNNSVTRFVKILKNWAIFFRVYFVFSKKCA